MIRFSEMAQFKGFGITIEVRSDDHGKLGNKKEPAHAHILDNAEKELAEVEITRDPPNKGTEIIWYRTPNPPQGLADKIVKLAKSPSKSAKMARITANVWQAIIMQWINFHGE